MNAKISVLLVLVAAVLLAACVPEVPTAPARIDVAITVVPEEQLGEAVAAALTGTASSDVAA
ncbi:MAG TPA: hypothetical protein VKY59_08625, partial [Spirillospora sp.]|nr:hypothetical protein [Spirillospora sp.]